VDRHLSCDIRTPTQSKTTDVSEQLMVSLEVAMKSRKEKPVMNTGSEWVLLAQGIFSQPL
tara:strand:+ start:95 stop:274 length:180 start_codon:yes stop_codon:yes gene_type:complete